MRRALGIVLVALPVVAALLSLAWLPGGGIAIDVARRLAPSSAAHPLGTDQVGRDLLAMLMAGARPPLLVALMGLSIGLSIGVPLGLLAARRPGWLDEGIARAGDVLFAFPALVTALLIVAVLGPGASRAGLAMGLFTIPVFVRVTRAAARRVWTQDYILAARLAGKGGWAITRDHVMPNIAGVLIVQASVQLALGIVAEAGLSYLGLGAQPPQPSWGRMLADGQTLVADAPRLVVLPGLAVALTVFGITLLGDLWVERRR